MAPGLINIKIKTKKQTLKGKTEGDWLVVIVVVSATHRRWVCLLLLLLLLHLVYRYESLFSIPLFEVTTASTFLFTAKIPNSSIHKFVNSITYSDSNSKSLGFSNFIFVNYAQFGGNRNETLLVQPAIAKVWKFGKYQMASAGDEDNDAVLSDVEGDDSVPVAIKTPSPDEISAERFRELVAELDRERQAREAVENSKSDLQIQFNRLKALAHEAIKKRDEWGRQRDEALRDKEEASKTNEKVSAELAESNRAKDEALQQRDEIAKQLDEVVKERDGLRSDIGNSTHMLMSGIDKISGKVSNFKNFGVGGLPRSQKYTTGLPAVAYGVIKRTNEIVEELVRQIDSTAKSRNETREQMDQRNYEIAIEISQLEATIGGLREEVVKKTSIVEKLEKSMAEKNGKVSEIEREMEEKLSKAESEVSELKQLVGEYDDKLTNLDSKMEAQRPLLFDQLDLVSKIHDRLYHVMRIVDANNLDQSEFSESLFLPQETDMEENIRATLAGMESIYELTRIVIEKTRDLTEEKNREIKSLDETVNRLVKEKEQIGSLLRSALSKRITSSPSSKTSELFQVAENGLREAGIDFKFSKHVGDGKVDTLETEEDEIYALVSNCYY